jgi:hypothetical protein
MTVNEEISAPFALRVDDFRQRMGGRSRSHFYQLVARDQIRVVKLGRRTLVPASEAERLLLLSERK